SACCSRAPSGITHPRRKSRSTSTGPAAALRLHGTTRDRRCVMAKILFIVSGAAYWVLKDGTRHATGYWAEEFANPYKIVTDAAHEVVVATPDGVTPSVDMMSRRREMAGGVQGALELETIIRSAEVIRRPLELSDVRLEDYDAVYLPGGHGPMADLAF